MDAHKAPCLEVRWSPFNDCIIASCSEDTTAKVWLIPQHGLSRTLSEPVVELAGHQKRVNTLEWHPTANNILFTAGGENVILVWNVGTGEALLEVSLLVSNKYFNIKLILGWWTSRSNMVYGIQL